MKSRLLARALAALAALYVVALGIATSGPVERRLRTAIHGALRARLGDVRLGDDLRVDLLFRVSFGPIELPEGDGRPVAVRVERAIVRPSLAALLRGRVEPATVKLRGLVVALSRPGAPLALGPLDVDLRGARHADGTTLRADVSLRSGGQGRLDADVDPSGSTARVRAEVEGIVLSGARIAPEPVGPLRASAAGTLAWDGAARRLVLRDGTATLLRTFVIAASGELAAGPPATFALSLEARRVDWPAAVAALPSALALPPLAPVPPGTLDARLALSGPLLSPAEWSVSAALDLSALRAAARRAGPSPLAEPFVHRPPLDEGGRGPDLLVGPRSPDFVPIAELPEHVLRAVTGSEDGGFFAHPGFDFEELRNAFAQGAQRGRLVRGGSTISQQVAKNLFLGPERTFARKLREAAITIGLEATLPKRRLLEIYLNVAEWGPGLWGIGPAARLWFGKDARTLTPKEAAFLASVIPNPVRFHGALLARGAPTETWEVRVRDLLHTMADQGALTPEQLFEALAQPVTFAPAVSAAAGSEEPVPAAASAPAPPAPAP